MQVKAKQVEEDFVEREIKLSKEYLKDEAFLVAVDK